MIMRRVAVAGALVGLLTAPLVLAWTPGAAGASRTERLLPLTAGSRVDHPENYTRMQGLFTADADLWGGAYVEDDLLVVKVVGQSLDLAQSSLKAVGVTAGIKLLASDVSLAALDAQKARVAESLGGQSQATSWGPDYAASSIVVSVTGPSPGIQRILKQAADPDGPPVTISNTYSPAGNVTVPGDHEAP